eukprot:10433662-Alexandrium_andersonii.AAC.1
MDSAFAAASSFYGNLRCCVQPKKCAMLSTCSVRRKKLRIRSRAAGKNGYAVQLAVRDLGAMLNMSQGHGTGLQRLRFERAADAAKKMLRL